MTATPLRLPAIALPDAGHTTLSGVPEGVDGMLLAKLAAREAPKVVCFVARDDARLDRVSDALAFFAPALEQRAIPAWDCLPYDRVSPRSDIASRRVAGLVALATRAPGPLVVLTTVNAIVQRVPPRRMLADAGFAIGTGDALDHAALLAYLEHNGFVRTGTVMEAGEYAVRGSIVDIFPPSVDAPVRLDLFGDTVESIRAFDPVTQRSQGAQPAAVLAPVSEVLLNDASIASFRSGYRTLFGAVTREDPLFEAITAGRHYPGMEHWLPLFHDGLETLFDYLPDAAFVLDRHVEQALGDRLEAIADFYQARADEPAAAVDAPPYKPVPTERLYLSEAEWEQAFERRSVAAIAGYDEPARGGQVDVGGRPGRDFVGERLQADGALFDAVEGHAAARRRRGDRVLIACVSAGSRERIRRLLSEHGVTEIEAVDDWPSADALDAGRIALTALALEHGFYAPALTVIAEADMLGTRLSRPSKRRRVRAEHFLADATELAEGDLVVHVDHGIGRYDGLETLTVDQAPHDCLRILYEGDDKLFVPVEQIDMLSRYGSADQPVSLDRLGGVAWQARKARLKKRIRALANELIKVAAARATKPAPVLEAPSAPYEAFCARFPYAETEDQARAIDETLDDLGSARPMDRLICGDVGFGKTEVALRAAFHAVQCGKQVAVLVPTTLLARQHTHTFAARFADLPVRIAQLSRLVGAKDQAAVRRGIAAGEVDIVIGTHALLAETIAFNNLGLLIVDEEQHFGVAHKEKLKKLRADVHVLTLTATPIPRTLQMALSGVRDMSVISTPPLDRLAVRTFILPFDPVTVREALMREHLRGGQTFYVCPRIADLDRVADRVAKLTPEIKIALAHGRMTPRAIEDAMASFYEGSCGVLVSTAIIESGLDLPRVNTMIVHRADMFGLAQLYQLRGRIGRAKLRGYAYLTLPPEHRLTGAAHKRLQVIHRLDSLGAGFSLASHDLDIRGAGNLLGSEQSGHVREVGIELYQHMIEEAVATARAEAGEGVTPIDAAWSPSISLGGAVLIPDGYVADLDVRLSLYRRIATFETRADIDAFVDELTDRFGPPPDSVIHLLEIVAIKHLCRKTGVAKLEAGPRGAVLSFRDDMFANPDALIRYISAPEREIRLRPDSSLVLARKWPKASDRVSGVQRLLRDLSEMVEPA